MEIREYAENLLFGTTLEAKLLRPRELSDERPGSPLADVPRAPGRPATLRLRSKEERVALPGARATRNLRDLERAENRGALLHHFANHEILAVELMALALLLFPDAPADFRRSLIGSIAEEQKHFRMYRKRMRAMGVDFGDVPVNDFFWKHLAYPNTMRAPIDFAVRMGMTFEQANLDYMRHYTRVFRGLGDARTVAVLEIVLRDEIGHVRNGVRWFEHYRGEAVDAHPEVGAAADCAARSQWADYVERLPEGLDPVRARGIGFESDARKQAGLSDEYIQALRLHACSRGRPPALYYFNPLCEASASRSLRTGSAKQVPISPRLQELTVDLESVLLFLSRHEDAVLLREAPRPEFLSEIQRAGFALPEIYAGPAGRAALVGRKLSDVRPWGVAPDSLAELRFAFAEVVGRRGDELREHGAVLFERHAALYSRELSALLAREFARECSAAGSRLLAGSDESALIEGDYCREFDELLASCARLASAGHRRAVIKADFSTAGRQRMRVDLPLPADSNDPNRLALARFWERETGARSAERSEVRAGVRVEPWLERIADFSIQLNVLDDGSVKIPGAVRLFNSDAGAFRGCLTGRLFDGLNASSRRVLADPRTGALPVLFAAAEFVGQRLARRGFRGPAGIDAFAAHDPRAPGGLPFLRPIVEINPRFTMGRVALELGRRVRRHRAALWVHLPAQPFGDPQLRRALIAAAPLQMRDGLIDAGLLFTGDPERARQRCQLLLVGPDLDHCRRLIHEHGLGDFC